MEGIPRTVKTFLSSYNFSAVNVLSCEFIFYNKNDRKFLYGKSHTHTHTDRMDARLDMLATTIVFFLLPFEIFRNEKEHVKKNEKRKKKRKSRLVM